MSPVRAAVIVILVAASKEERVLVGADMTVFCVICPQVCPALPNGRVLISGASHLMLKMLVDQPRLTRTPIILLAGVAIATAIAPLTLVRGAIRRWSQLPASSSVSPRSFEVAAIRPDHSGEGFNANITAGRFVMKRCTVMDLIEYSYDLKESQVLGAPKWINSEKYDIEAKVEDSVVATEQKMSNEQRIFAMRSRVQGLLANRFGLRVHHSMKVLPALALVTTKGGPKFSRAAERSTPGADSDGREVSMRMDGKRWVLTLDQAPMRYLVLVLSRQPEIGRSVLVDKTGLAGDYALELSWEPQDLTAAASGASEHSGPTLFTAVREQLGLRLEARKESVDVLVLDGIERPSEN